MESGIGATIMFVYPVIVAAIMITGFKEKLTIQVIAATVLALAGVGILCRPGSGAAVNALGVFYVLLSAFFYAVYIVILKVTRLKEIAPDTLTFYTMGIGALIFLAVLKGVDLQMLPSFKALGNALGLAFFPSLLSFWLIAVAVKYIGATKSAILGALEPVTAVIIGVAFFSEKFTWALLGGIVCILSSVVIIVGGKQKEVQSPTAAAENK